MVGMDMMTNGMPASARTSAPSIASLSCTSGAIVQQISEKGGRALTSSRLPRNTVAISTP